MTPPSDLASWNLVLAAASCLAALVASLAAIWSALSARRVERIAQQEHKDRHLGVTLYLIDSARWRTKDEKETVNFAISISNVAAAPASISSVRLCINAFSPDGQPCTAILEPKQQLAKSPWPTEPLSVPINLPAKTTISGHLSFGIPEHIYSNKRIDSYELKAVSGATEAATVTAYLVKRISDAELVR